MTRPWQKQFNKTGDMRKKVVLGLLSRGVGSGKSLKLNEEGGITPYTPEQVEKYRQVDLITLPQMVPGTNCGNCTYFKEQKTGEFALCKHPKVLEPVTERMCCALWDNRGVKRSWEE